MSQAWSYMSVLCCSVAFVYDIEFPSKGRTMGRNTFILQYLLMEPNRIQLLKAIDVTSLLGYEIGKLVRNRWRFHCSDCSARADPVGSALGQYLGSSWSPETPCNAALPWDTLIQSAPCASCPGYQRNRTPIQTHPHQDVESRRKSKLLALSQDRLLQLWHGRT